MKRLFQLYADAYKGLSRASWMLAIVMLINRTGSMVLPFLGVYMMEHLDFSLEESGFVLSLFGLGSVAGSFIGGYLTDKIGAYYVQAFSLFTSVLLFCLLPQFTTVTSLSVMIFLHSVISELFRPANSVAITKYAKPENITRSFSLNRMAVNLGFSIGPALGGILAAISYHFLFYANAATALIAGITYVFFFRRRQQILRRRQAAAKVNIAAQQLPGKSPYRDLKFIVFCLLCSVFSICFFQLLNTVPLFYKEVVRLDQQTIGLLLGFSGLVVVLLEMLLVNFADRRLGIVRTMVAGCVLCGLSYGMIGFDYSIATLLGSIALLSCGEILVLPFMATITAKSSGEHNKGRYMGMNGIAVALAFIISPLLGSYIASRFGFNILWISTAILLFLAAWGFYYATRWLLQKKTTEI